MDGKGEFTWPDGKSYFGNYENDEKNGYGEFNWPDGRMYSGNWENNKQHGRGVYINSSGQERKGEWRKGIKIRWIDSNTVSQKEVSVDFLLNSK